MIGPSAPHPPRPGARRGAAALLGLLLLLCAAPAAASDDLDLEVVEIDAGAFPEVTLEIALPSELADRSLTADDFVVVEGGRRVAAAVWATAEEPMEVLLLLDTSGSMAGAALDAAKSAALEFVHRIPEAAAVGVVAFGNSVLAVATLGDGREAVEGAIGGLAAGGETALFDAAAMVPELFGGDPTMRRVVVILSDGGDTVSETALGEAAAALESVGAEVFAVALDTSESDRGSLGDLVRPADGQVVETAAVGELAGLYAAIADEILGRYTLTYLSRASGSVWVTVSVTDGGATAIGSIRFDAPVEEAAAAGGAAEPRPPVTEVALPEAEAPGPEIVPDPGPLGGPWTIWVGVGALLAAVGLGVRLLLRPDREGRVPVEGVAPAVAKGARGVLSMLSRSAETAADGVLHLRKGTRLDTALDRAGVALRPSEFVVLGTAVAVSGIALGLTLGGPVGAILFGIPALAAPRITLRMLTARRRAAFADQLEGTLQMVAGSLRAGYGLMQAITTVAAESPSPTAEEFDRVVVEERLGRPLVDSLNAMAGRMDDDDLRWAVEAIDIQQDVGGNLAEVLDTVAATIRDRNQIRRQIRALSAEGRMSAVILLVLPFCLAGLISSISPDYIAELTSSTMGRVLLAFGLLLMAIGAGWIRRIVRVVF